MSNKEYPLGAVVHFTAGRAGSEEDAKNTFDWLLKNGLKAVVIGPLGKCYYPPNWDTEWGAHAGNSYHPDLGNNVSKHLVGVEIACEGKLEFKNGKYYSWFGSVIPSERVNSYSERVHNIEPGHYAAFTTQQFEALVTLLFDLKDRFEHFSFDYVLGHDEVAIPKGRKNDPGGSLGMTMPQFRDYLKERYRQERQNLPKKEEEGKKSDNEAVQKRKAASPEERPAATGFFAKLKSFFIKLLR